MNHDPFYQALLDTTNIYRASKGLPALKELKRRKPLPEVETNDNRYNDPRHEPYSQQRSK